MQEGNNGKATGLYLDWSLLQSAAHLPLTVDAWEHVTAAVLMNRRMTVGMRIILRMYTEKTIAQMQSHALYAEARSVREKWSRLESLLNPRVFDLNFAMGFVVGVLCTLL